MTHLLKLLTVLWRGTLGRRPAATVIPAGAYPGDATIPTDSGGGRPTGVPSAAAPPPWNTVRRGDPVIVETSDGQRGTWCVDTPPAVAEDGLVSFTVVGFPASDVVASWVHNPPALSTLAGKAGR